MVALPYKCPQKHLTLSALRFDRVRVQPVYAVLAWPELTTSVCSLVRAFAAQAEQAAEAPQRTHFGGLKDEDRIFTNLYGRNDPFIKVGTPSPAALHWVLSSAQLCEHLAWWVKASLPCCVLWSGRNEPRRLAPHQGPCRQGC